MFGAGLVMLAMGIWLVDSAVQGRQPIATLKAMIADPANYRAELEGSKGTLTVAGGGGTTPPAPTGPDTFSGGIGGGGGGGGSGAPPAGSLGNTTAPLASGKAATAIAYAKAQLGKPYKWGKAGPASFDCSGLTYMAWKAAGVKIPRVTAGQIVTGRRVAKKNLQPGDLVFPVPEIGGRGHVQMYIGNGQIIEAAHPGTNVRIMPLGNVVVARRVG